MEGASAGAGQGTSSATGQSASTNSTQSTQSATSESVAAESATPETTQETTTETPAETPAEKKRHKLYDSLKKLTEKDYDDDNSLMDDADSKLSELSEYQKTNESVNAQIVDAVEANPELGAVIADVIKGLSFRAALAKHFDPADLSAEEGDPDAEALENSKKERLAKKAENDKFISELNENIKFSQEEARAFIEEKGMDEEAASAFTQSVSDVFIDAYKGKISKDTLAKLFVAENHEKEVADAAKNGFIEGKNAKIDEKKADPVSDGLPQIQGSANPPAAPKKPSNDIENIVDYSLNSRKF